MQQLRSVYWHILIRGLLMGALLMTCSSCTYERIYSPTESSTFEVKKLPESTAVMAENEGDYFRHDDTLFRRLFNFIKEEKISMTVPVEMRREPAKMYFLLGRGENKGKVTPKEDVDVVSLPERTVASYGTRGRYNAGNFEKAAQRLQTWLRKQKRYVPTDDPYGEYWNGPIRLPFLKRFEVHIPIQEPRGKDGTEKARWN